MKFVTKRACPLNQWIAKHTTMMSDEGGATGVNMGFLKRRTSLLLDELLSICPYHV